MIEPNPSTCAYCDCEIPEEDLLTVPKASDDAEWERLAEQHAPGCEWIATRAHRRGSEWIATEDPAAESDD
jgi:hypothetical protein